MKKTIWLLLICLVACTFTNAQVDVKNTSVLFLSNSTDTLYINGNYTNTDSAAFTNNGIVQIKQNLTNDQAAMAVGSGTLYLNGSSAQIISGSQAFKTYNLVTNNSAGITLNNNLSVSGVHTYTAGMITTSATPNYMIYESGSSYTGDADSKHVNGWVKKTGSTNFIFPVGNATYERTVSLTNLTAASEFNVMHNGAVTPNRYSLFDPLVFVDSAEYWTINKISGSAAKVAMNWDNSKIQFPMLMLSDIRATYYDGNFWRSIGGSATGNILTTGAVTSNSVSVFNANFTIGSISYVLPLKIIRFSAGRINDYTKINWTIGNELNISYYELERSDDGIHFYTVSVQSPLNRNSTEFYSYDDRKLLKGTAFYRLKINNITSQVNYSNIVTVTVTDIGKAFYVITNPVDASIDIYAEASVKGIYNYTITSTGGQMIQSGILDIKYGGYYSIDLKYVFVTGAYILTVRNEQNKMQRTIFKK